MNIHLFRYLVILYINLVDLSLKKTGRNQLNLLPFFLREREGHQLNLGVIVIPKFIGIPQKCYIKLMF